jgi:hypothetical protein
MKSAFLAFLSGLLVCACAFAVDTKLEAIKFLVIDLSKYPEWTKGDFISLPLPANATFDQLTDAYLKQAKFKWGAIKDYDIEETQDCEIPPKSKQIYKIVRISSEQGGKFLIFRFDSDHWWSKNYDAKEQYLKAEQDATAGSYATPGHGSSNQINESNGKSGCLDLRGYPEGAKVKDPYTGKIVIVSRASVSPTPAKSAEQDAAANP